MFFLRFFQNFRAIIWFVFLLQIARPLGAMMPDGDPGDEKTRNSTPTIKPSFQIFSGNDCVPEASSAFGGYKRKSPGNSQLPENFEHEGTDNGTKGNAGKTPENTENNDAPVGQKIKEEWSHKKKRRLVVTEDHPMNTGNEIITPETNLYAIAKSGFTYENHTLEVPELVRYICEFVEDLKDIVSYGLVSKSAWKSIILFPHERHMEIKNTQHALQFLSSPVQVKSLIFSFNIETLDKETKDLLSQAIWTEALEFRKGLPDFSLFANYNKLASLVLKGNYAGDEQPRVVAKSQPLRNLVSLRIENNYVGNDGIKQIAQSRVLTNLEHLYLNGNEIGNDGLTDLAIYGTFTNLISLGLRCNEISDESAITLSESQIVNNLEYLNLERNDITYIGTRSIAKSTKLSKLKFLDLGSNEEIGDEGATALSESKTLNNLEHLNLERNGITHTGTLSIAKSTGPGKLKFLNLGSNGIGDEGAIALSKSKTLNNIEHLNLKDNDISNKGAKALLKSKTLKDLKSLNLKHNNDISEKLKDRLINHFGVRLKI